MPAGNIRFPQSSFNDLMGRLVKLKKEITEHSGVCRLNFTDNFNMDYWTVGAFDPDSASAVTKALNYILEEAESRGITAG